MSAERPPLIIVAHRILIGAGILFFAFFAIWEALAWRRTGQVGNLVGAILAALVTVAMAYSLKNLRRFVR
ncbi:MAG: hypothetical protein HYV62_00905 [Candidatus Rokubacteria bacterium]|nr:hypothetical protein [Candidatus Rokubacteria bacterium]